MNLPSEPLTRRPCAHRPSIANKPVAALCQHMRGGPWDGPTVIGRRKRTTPRPAKEARHRIDPLDPCGGTPVACTRWLSCLALTLRGISWKLKPQVGICDVKRGPAAAGNHFDSEFATTYGREKTRRTSRTEALALPIATLRSDTTDAIHLWHFSNTVAPLRRTTTPAAMGPPHLPHKNRQRKTLSPSVHP